MTILPSPYPHRVVSDWITANDVHVLKGAQKPLMTGFDGTNLDLFDYSLAIRWARKAQAKAVVQAFDTLGRTIKRFWVTAWPDLMGSFWSQLKAGREKRRAMAALSGLSTHMLNDSGITTIDVAAVRSGRVTLTELNEIRRSG